jgi:UDP-2,3-diacylglucosamine pyrophosphatase LpxH
MSNRNTVLLFGDVTCDYDAGLQALAARKDSPILTDFFARVAFALRSEIGNLSISDRENNGLVKFTGFVELLARLRKVKTRHHALDKALTCVHQFASFIRYVAHEYQPTYI